MTKTLAELLGGADMEGGENFCDTIYNNLKNHFRSSAPCVSGGLDELQPGMIVSDEDDDRLYHVILTSACTCSEIVQTCIPVSDDNGVYFGDGNDAYLGYNELNNDALMLGIPTTGRGLIICEAGDVAQNMTGFLPGVSDTEFFIADKDLDSYMSIGFSTDDVASIEANVTLHFQLNADNDAAFFQGAASGDNRFLYLYGWDTVAAATRWGRLRIEPSLGRLVVDAQDGGEIQQGGTVVAEWTSSLLRMLDDKQLQFGSGDDAAMEYDEGTNDALMIGVPETPARGVIICQRTDMVNDYTALISAQADPAFWWVDDDRDSFLGAGHQGDDLPGVWAGGAAAALHFQHDAAVDVQFFAGAANGENPDVYILGYVTAGTAARYARLRMDDTNDEFEIEAEDNANMEGITALIPQADQMFRVRGAARALRFTIKSDGRIGTDQTAAGTTLGNVTDYFPIYDETDTLVGYVPIYDSIT